MVKLHMYSIEIKYDSVAPLDMPGSFTYFFYRAPETMIWPRPQGYYSVAVASPNR